MSDHQLIVWNGKWSTNDVKKNTDKLFIFGDNNKQSGRGGQAIIRYEPNTQGIPTKAAWDEFYNDDNYEDNCKRISQSVDKCIQRGYNYSSIVFPYDSIGTGLADLKNKAPKTWEFMINDLNRISSEKDWFKNNTKQMG